ncbi:MAG: peptidase M48, partial [Dolichospermum sp.]
LSHPFPVERLHYLRSWAVSEEYQEIRKGNYEYSADGSVNVTPKTPENEAERLRQQIEELQQEINKIKK